MSKRRRARHSSGRQETARPAAVSPVFTVKAGGTTYVPTAHLLSAKQPPPPKAQEPSYIDVEGLKVPIEYGEGKFCIYGARLPSSNEGSRADGGTKPVKFIPKAQWLIQAHASDITIEAPNGWSPADIQSPDTIILRFKNSNAVILVCNSSNHAVLVDRDPLSRQEYEGMSYRDTRARESVRTVELTHFSDPDRARRAFISGVKKLVDVTIDKLPPKGLGNVDWSSEKHLAVRSVLMAFAKIEGLVFTRDFLNMKIGDFIGEALDERPEDFGGAENTEKIRVRRMGALDSIIRYSFEKASKAKAPDPFEQRGLPKEACNLPSAYAWARARGVAATASLE